MPDEVMHAGGEWWARVKGPKGVGEPIAGEDLVGGEKMADPQARSEFSPELSLSALRWVGPEESRSDPILWRSLN